MKAKHVSIILCALLLGGFLVSQLLAAEAPSSGPYEYITIRWAGRDNTHVIRPGGQVEFIGMELRKVERPDRTDDRAFYMNIAMNGLTKEGYEFAGMTHDVIVMKRPLR